MPNKSWDAIYRREVKEGYVDRKSGKYLYYDVEKPHEDLGKFVAALKKSRPKPGQAGKAKAIRVLDLGCGAGRNLIPLAKLGYEVSGIDISEAGLEIIREKLGRQMVQLRCGDVFCRLPYPGQGFDAVMSVQVLNHGTEKRILNAIGEIERVLKPGGIVFITLPGIYEKGKMRYYYNHDSREIGPRTKMPTRGEEKGLPHFFFNKKILLKHFRNFRLLEFWKDKRDYYAFIAEKE